jgi:hypothetical protein
LPISRTNSINTDVSPKATLEQYVTPVLLDKVGDEDMSWLKCSVIGAIYEDVNFSSIRQSLIDDGIQFNGFCFLGATQVLIVFKSESDMMDAFYEEYQLWTTYFDELRPWLPTYCPIDRFPWKRMDGLPLL